MSLSILSPSLPSWGGVGKRAALLQVVLGWDVGWDGAWSTGWLGHVLSL